MHSLSELTGKPIVSEDRGEKIGKVRDVLVDADNCRGAGLIVQGGLLSSERVLPYDDVKVLGRDAIIARSADAAVDAATCKERGISTTRASDLRNRRVITRGDRELGAVNDLYLDDSGTIEGYDVESSAFGGIVRRHAHLPHTTDVAISEDAMIGRHDCHRYRGRGAQRAGPTQTDVTFGCRRGLDRRHQPISKGDVDEDQY